MGKRGRQPKTAPVEPTEEPAVVLPDPLDGEQPPQVTASFLNEKPQVAIRMMEVQRRLLLAHDPVRIQNELSAAWHCTRRTIRNYLRAVFAEWKRQAMEEPRDDYEMCRRGLLDTIDRALTANPPDIVSAQRGWRELARLGGLYIEKHEHTGPNGQPLNLGIGIGDAVDQLRAVVAGLSAGGATPTGDRQPDPTG